MIQCRPSCSMTVPSFTTISMVFWVSYKNFNASSLQSFINKIPSPLKKSLIAITHITPETELWLPYSKKKIAPNRFKFCATPFVYPHPFVGVPPTKHSQQHTPNPENQSPPTAPPPWLV